MLAGLTAVALLIDPASSGSADALERLAVGFTVRCGLVWDAAGAGTASSLEQSGPPLGEVIPPKEQRRRPRPASHIGRLHSGAEGAGRQQCLLSSDRQGFVGQQRLLLR